MSVLDRQVPSTHVTSAATRAAPPAGPPQKRVAALGLGVAAVLLAVLLTGHGLTQAVLFTLGLGLGVALFHARFGFTSAWRQLVTVGQGRALRAHTLLLGATAVLFAPVLALGIGNDPAGYVSPVGVSVVLGAALFGLGMQVGGSCASGTLFAVGSGQTAIVLTLGGFVGGATLGAAHLGWWAQTPAVGPVDLAATLGTPAALGLTLAALAGVAGATYVVGRRRNPPPPEPVPTARGVARVLRGSWPLWVGALALAVLNLGVLVTSGSPWGVTGAFALWGSKAAGALGADPGAWAFWQGPAAATLSGSVLDDTTTLTNLGIMVGALVASALGGAFTLHRRVPARLAAGAVLGGLLMGYGARLAYGCNIGAYLGGIASFSLHGWLWAVAALAGTWAGVKARPLFGLGNPKTGDGVC